MGYDFSECAETTPEAQLSQLPSAPEIELTGVFLGIANYRTAELDRGAIGIVYKARDPIIARATVVAT